MRLSVAQINKLILYLSHVSFRSINESTKGRWITTIKFTKQKYSDQTIKTKITVSIAKCKNADICVDKLSSEFCYRSLDEFKTTINLLKLPSDWVIENKNEYRLIKEVDATLVLPKVEIYASNDLRFYIRIYGQNLAHFHKLYVNYNILQIYYPVKIYIRNYCYEIVSRNTCTWYQ